MMKNSLVQKTVQRYAIYFTIINAIYDAVGIKLSALPASPERVLKALEAQKNT
jgi:hypothetical protein